MTTQIAPPDLEALLDDPVDGDNRTCDLLLLDRQARKWVRCNRPAEWILRTRLSCNHPPQSRVLLVCQECADAVLGDVPEDQRPVILCPRPRCDQAAEILSVEPLR